MADETDNADRTLLTLTADIVAAHVANNSVPPAEVTELIAKVHAALAGLGEAAAAGPAEEQKPAVAIRSSVKPDYLVCLEDGKKLTMLKRYLQTRYGMTPQQYRAKWKLPADYPMVAPNYAERRRVLAREMGLGRKRPAPPPAKPAARRGRKKAS